jgi:ubiquinone/menaquinone biosynthesis C-methylase UbiE
MAERRFDDFDPFADNYRSIHDRNVAISGGNSRYFARMKVELIAELGPQVPFSMLDLGCGDGETAAIIPDFFPGAWIEGIDVSAQSIQVAQARQLPHASFQVYNGTDIPFPEQQFDFVFVAGVFHHVDRQYHIRIMQEIARVLKPGGQLFLFEHNPWNPATRYLVKTCVFDQDAHLLSAPYMRRVIRLANLALLPTRFILFFPRGKAFRWLHPAEKWMKRLPLGAQYLLQAIKAS